MTDRYEIAFQIGEDALGAIYVANDLMLKRRVMMRNIDYGDHPNVEIRDDSWRNEFTQYAGRLSTMQHPNMLALYDITVGDKGAAVVTQYVKGESLAERLASGGLGQIGVYKMATDMLDVLHAAHTSNVFHGAFHTGSIRRVPRAAGGHRYLLMDLGLNQLASMVRAKKVKVLDPVLLAPEMHDQSQEPDAKADLFMFGQLCYTALVNRHPFSGKSREECLSAYQEIGTPHLREHMDGIDPGFAAWVMSLVEVDPKRRPANTEDAMAQLDAVDIGEPEPNVAGKTHAVKKKYVVPTPKPKKEELSLVTNSRSDSVYTAAANSAAAARRTVDEVQNMGSSNIGASMQRKSGKKMLAFIVVVLVILTIGGLLVAFNKGLIG